MASMGASYELFLPDPTLVAFYDRLYSQVYKVFYDRVQDLDALRTRLSSGL